MFRRLSTFVIPAAGIVLSGCTLVTDLPPAKQLPVGGDLVINEIFALPPDRYYAYSWIELYNPTESTISWFDETFPASLNVAGWGGTFTLTNDDGGNWTPPPAVPAINFNDINFPYQDTGYAVGNEGEIRRIVRRSGAYEFDLPESAPTVSNLNALSSVPLTVSAYAVGDNGTIIRTTTRGRTWTQQNPPTTKNINDVAMFSVSLVYACGDSGLILKSPVTNTWQVKTIGDAFRLVDFHTMGIVADSVWAAGSQGTVLVSRNRGENWLAETTNVTTTLRGSVFLRTTPARAWIVGDSGTILYKEGFGGTWVAQQSGTTEQLNDVSFIDAERGWATGNNGLILHTTNSGLTWTSQPSGVTTSLQAVYPLPLSIRVLSRYVIQMYAIRKEFFFDPSTGTINFDYIIRQDTGYCLFDPIILQDEAGAPPPKPIPRNGFVVINSDSGRFDEHTDIGPGKTHVLNFSVAYYFDTTSQFGVRPVLWDLLESGEVRILKFHFRELVSTGQFLEFTQSTVDVVRWGGYTPTAADFPPEELFPNNQPAGPIPEWWSLARYVNDAGTAVGEQNTAASFYMAEKPVPGWYSQISK